MNNLFWNKVKFASFFGVVFALICLIVPLALAPDWTWDIRLMLVLFGFVFPFIALGT